MTTSEITRPSVTPLETCRTSYTSQLVEEVNSWLSDRSQCLDSNRL